MDSTFGYNSKALILGALEKRLGNPNVTWETALKQNYGLDVHFLKSRLKISLDYFLEERKDILINRKTVPLLTGVDFINLPAVNMGKVKNRGYEVEVRWNDKIGQVQYNVQANVSYSKNKIISKTKLSLMNLICGGQEIRSGHSSGMWRTVSIQKRTSERTANWWQVCPIRVCP